MTDRLLAARWPVPLAFVVLVVALWQVAGVIGVLPRYVLAPSAILVGTWQLLSDGDLLPAIWRTVQRQLIGFLIGAGTGVVIGLLAGVFRAAEDVFDTLVSWTYPLPKIALFPIVVVWLGFMDQARILIIALSTIYPAFVNSFAGTRSIEPRMLWVARNVEAGRWRTFWGVVVRGAMPSIVVGVRISLALSFILAFATEAIGASRDGLGFLIEEGFNNLLYEWMYAGVLAFAVLGFIADQTWVQISERLLRGQRTEALGRA